MIWEGLLFIAPWVGLVAWLWRIEQHERNKIMTKLNELAAELAKVRDQLRKGIAEVTDKIDRLTEALENTEIPAAAQTLLDELKADAETLDAIVPDETPAQRS